MACVTEGDGYTVHYREGPIIINTDKLSHCFLRVRGPIQWFDGRQAMFCALPGNEIRVNPLNFCGIRKHDARQVTRGKGAIDVPFESLAAKVRQISTMIDVGVA